MFKTTSVAPAKHYMTSLTDQDFDLLLQFADDCRHEPDRKELVARAKETILRTRRGDHEKTSGGPGRSWSVREISFDPEGGDGTKRGSVNVIFEPPER